MKAKICPYKDCRKEITSRLRPGKLCPHCGKALVETSEGYITWSDNLIAGKLVAEFERMVSHDREMTFYFQKKDKIVQLAMAKRLLDKVIDFLDRQADTQTDVNDFALELVRGFFLIKKKDYIVTSLAQVHKGFTETVAKIYGEFKKRIAFEKNNSPYRDNPPIFSDIMRL